MVTKFLENIDEISLFLVALIVSLVLLPMWAYIAVNTVIMARCVWIGGFPSARLLLWAMILIGIPTYVAVIFDNVKSGVKWYESL